jgi:CRP/FNR family cyclic AMP-dependent transcriptional regulator
MGVLQTSCPREIAENCLTCTLRRDGFFCGFSQKALQALAVNSYTSIYPEGSVLFVEGQSPRGVYVLCRGRVKLSMVSSEGRTLILRVAEAGEVLGLSSCTLGNPYMVTAETLCSSQVDFMKREDFVRFVRENSEVAFRVAEWLSKEYQSACDELGALGLAHSAAEKLARLLLQWKDTKVSTKGRPRLINMSMTHEEMAQMIGASRETVTRMLARFRTRDYIEIQGNTMLIRDMEALERLAGNSRIAESAPETKSRAFPMCRPAPLKPSQAAGCATTGINRMPTIPSVTRPETRVAHYNATRSSLRDQMMGAKVQERKL